MYPSLDVLRALLFDMLVEDLGLALHVRPLLSNTLLVHDIISAGGQIWVKPKRELPEDLFFQ